MTTSGADFPSSSVTQTAPLVVRVRPYGDMRRDELDIIEVGARVAHAYDEAHAIQSRLVKATGEPLVLMQQLEWQWARARTV